MKSMSMSMSLVVKYWSRSLTCKSSLTSLFTGGDDEKMSRSQRRYFVLLLTLLLSESKVRLCVSHPL